MMPIHSYLTVQNAEATDQWKLVPSSAEEGTSFCKPSVLAGMFFAAVTLDKAVECNYIQLLQF